MGYRTISRIARATAISRMLAAFAAKHDTDIVYCVNTSPLKQHLETPIITRHRIVHDTVFKKLHPTQTLPLQPVDMFADWPSAFTEVQRRVAALYDLLEHDKTTKRVSAKKLTILERRVTTLDLRAQSLVEADILEWTTHRAGDRGFNIEGVTGDARIIPVTILSISPEGRIIIRSDATGKPPVHARNHFFTTFKDAQAFALDQARKGIEVHSAALAAFECDHRRLLDSSEKG